MSYYDIVGYAGDAALYCTPCAGRRYGTLAEGQEDREGNPLAPVFDGDATWEDICDDCQEPILAVFGYHWA